MTRTAVLGGGLSGLVCAHALARRGADVVLFEAGDVPGGVIQSEERAGYLLEWGPNTVKPTPAIWRLTEELGLSGEILLADPKAPRYVDYGGRLHRVPMSPGSFFGTRLLSISGKLRLLAEPLVARGGREGETVRELMTRRIGREATERLVEPFVAGIFAGDADQLEAAAAFSKLVGFEREHGGLLRGALASRRKVAGAGGPPGLLSFRRGMATLPRALAFALDGRMTFGQRAQTLRRDGEKWRVGHTAGETLCDRVVLALPAYEAAKLLALLAPEGAAALAAISYPPLAVLHASYPEEAFARPLRGFGHLVAPQAGRRILGAVWSSSLFHARAPQGRILLTVFLGGARDPRTPSLPDEKLFDTAAADLSAALGVNRDPDLVAVRRWERSIPQYVTGHSERLSAIEAAERKLPGLFLIGSYRGGISVGEVVVSAERAGSSL